MDPVADNRSEELVACYLEMSSVVEDCSQQLDKNRLEIKDAVLQDHRPRELEAYDHQQH
ncbi:MAG: hypothetical protein Q9228_007581, partial [Teloschistes exilis]